ncbi:hybrid sensor histidine kinase/response regulator [Mongoliimonas terrestris]|uniref:hybrid sensor histidine kinase/response regulator n=1 Tax=Mongoliimonas terrestris TaxID=1709001 RepID=UPI0009F86C3B|nr:response regulator [Mongoliimonas terrestris]
MSDFQAELMAAFDAEVKEHLGAIRRSLDRSGETSSAAASAAGGAAGADMTDVFRRAHSLKGAARAVDSAPVEDLAHRLEAVFQAMLDGHLGLDRPLRQAIDQALDAIEGHVAVLGEGGTPAATAAASAVLEPWIARAETAADDRPADATPPPADDPVSSGDAAPSADPPPDRDAVPAVDASPPPLSRAAFGRDAAPAGDDAATSAAGEGAPGAPGGADDPAVAADPAPADPAAPDPVPLESADAVLRVSARQVERLAGSLATVLGAVEARGGLSADLKAVGATARALARTVDEMRRPAAVLTAFAAETGDAAVLSEVRRLAARLKDLDRMAALLQADLGRLAQADRRQVFALERSATRLAEDVEGISLVPVDSVLGGLGRMVRDLARARGAEVRFRTVGFEALVDRRLLQALKDPVLHLVRNAVGHGAEPAAARTALGRPAEVDVVVTATVGGGRLTLTVADDGRGPDLARIEAVAVERGLIGQRAFGAPPPSPDRLLALVFEAGFSTAQAVDRLSGRGMGLSVVAEAVRRKRGQVELRARRPHGTEAVIEVPLAAALQSVLILVSDGRPYGLPSHGVERLLRLPVETMRTVEGRPAVWIEIGGRDVVIPIVTLPEILGQPAVPLPLHAGHLTVATIRRGERRLGLAVDALSDARPMVVSALDGFGADARIVSGAVLADGGMPAPVLDAAALVARWVEGEGTRGAAGLGLADWRPPAETRAKTILVVDDSITTRTLEKSILESQGYRVLLSVDGLEALQLLRAGDTVVDLVVADVEMPRMDGFALLQAIRADARFKTLPVVMMTSRAAPEDVRRGLDLGASAYVAKQTFDQRDLLATIGQLL